MAALTGGLDRPIPAAAQLALLNALNPYMQKHHTHLVHAQALRADIVSSPDLWLPRRDAILHWLNAFLARAETGKFELAATDADDLAALDTFLRKKKIPTAG